MLKSVKFTNVKDIEDQVISFVAKEENGQTIEVNGEHIMTNPTFLGSVRSSKSKITKVIKEMVELSKHTDTTYIKWAEDQTKAVIVELVFTGDKFRRLVINKDKRVFSNEYGEFNNREERPVSFDKDVYHVIINILKGIFLEKDYNEFPEIKGLITNIVETLVKGGIIVCDRIDDILDQSVIDLIVKMFDEDEGINKKQAQIILAVRSPHVVEDNVFVENDGIFSLVEEKDIEEYYNSFHWTLKGKKQREVLSNLKQNIMLDKISEGLQ